MLLAWTWGTDLADARRRCNPREFLAWWAFYRCNPWGPTIDDRRSARLAYLVATSVERKGAQPDLSTYRYGLDAPRTVQTPVQSLQEMRAAMLGLVAKGYAERTPQE